MLNDELAEALLLRHRRIRVVFSQRGRDEKAILRRELLFEVDGAFKGVHHDGDVAGVDEHHGLRVEEDHRRHHNYCREERAHVTDVAATLTVFKTEARLLAEFI